MIAPVNTDHAFTFQPLLFTSYCAVILKVLPSGVVSPLVLEGKTPVPFICAFSWATMY